MRKKVFFLLAFCAAASSACFGNGLRIVSEPEYTADSSVDWAAGTLSLEITHTLDPSTPSLARAKGDAETDLDARLPEFLSRAISPVTVDSSHTFGDLLEADAALFERVNDLALRARRTELALSPDLSTLVARYVIPLFGEQGIASPLFPSRETLLRRKLGDVTTRAYTGLLIFAKGPLPMSGSARPAAARPALFPRIWDEQMNLVLDKGMCSPEWLQRWGMVGYSSDVEDPALALRVGNLPLRLAARGVFGDKPTDIIISLDGARQLLALPENIALLREGRICIVYDSLE